MKKYLISINIMLIATVLFLFNSVFAQCEWVLSEDALLSPGSYSEWDGDKVYDPAIIREDGIYHMWYTGCNSWWSIGYATSQNGLDWVKYEDNPVITDYSFTCAHPCIRMERDLFRIYFVGNIYEGCKQIYSGTSEDCINWDINFSRPALGLGSHGQWDDNNVHNPYVIQDGLEYKMYYSGEDGGGVFLIGMATSDDGVNWEKHEGNPILQTGYYPEWDYSNVNNPCVYHDGEMYHMWYNGYGTLSWAVGYAFSFDGFEWEKYPDNPVITDGEYWWCTSRIGCGVVRLYDNMLYMAPTGSDGYRHHIALATSILGEGEILRVDITPDGKYFSKEDGISFSRRIENITDEEQIFDTWWELYMIGQPYWDNPVWGPEESSLPPQGEKDAHFLRDIPDHVPSGGPYKLVLKTGDFPEEVWAQDHFRFYVLP